MNPNIELKRIKSIDSYYIKHNKNIELNTMFLIFSAMDRFELINTIKALKGK